MNQCSDPNLRVFTHHIYEYQKGLRNLVLHTMASESQDIVEQLLNRRCISHHIQQVTEKKINIFFGDSRCVEIIKSFNITSLSKLTDEQDFILGIMLGYDQRLQCERYLKRKETKVGAQPTQKVQEEVLNLSIAV